MYIASSFLLHLLWENAQAPFYEGYESFAQHFWICFWGTLTGDMVFMGVIYTILAVVHRNFFWLGSRDAYLRPVTWFFPPVIGVLLAVSYELWAVYSAHRWAYANMPLIPVLEVGVFPVLQMVVVPLIVLLVNFWWVLKGKI